MSNLARLLKRSNVRPTESNQIQIQAEVEHGEHTVEYRVDQLKTKVERMTETLATKLPILHDEAQNLIKMRTRLLEESLGKQTQAAGAPRITQADRQFVLRNCPEYVERMDAHMLATAKLIRNMQRTVTKLKEVVNTEGNLIAKDWSRDKIQMLIAHQHDPVVSMHFTDIEALITLPSEGRRAKRMIQLEEGAINGRPVSAERKAKLTPKPKAKIRAKRAKATIAEATAQPAIASVPPPLPKQFNP